MKHLKEITEKKLKNGQKYTFSNKDKTIQMKVDYDHGCLGFWISINSTPIYFSHCYKNTLKEIKELSLMLCISPV